PGDSWLPVVDYAFEGDVAIDCGRRLASFCNNRCAGAQGLSFLSHSLGARLVLEAVTHLAHKAPSVLLTPPSNNRDCLTAEYSRAMANSEMISILASTKTTLSRSLSASAIPSPICCTTTTPRSRRRSVLAGHPRRPRNRSASRGRSPIGTITATTIT